MHISWLGNSAIKIQAKPFDKDVVAVIDTYRPDKGNFPRSLLADLALYTRGENESITISGSPYVLSIPGEIETKGVLVTAVQGHEAGQVMLRLDTEQLSLAHLGMAKKALTDAQLDVLADVDILIIPVGGNNCYDAEAAAKAVNAIEPKIVIPVAHNSDNDPKAASVNLFLREMGVPKNGEPENKVIIKKKDLPMEEMRVIVLKKE